MTTSQILLTPGQRFAQQYGNRAVEEMLSAITWSKRVALVITAAAMVVSFQHQRHYLTSSRMDTLGAIIIPLMIDALTLLCVKVLSTTGMARSAKAVSLGFLLFPVGASGWINFSASPNMTVGIVYVIAVAFIAVAETIKAFIKPDFVSILAEEARVQPARRVGTKLTEEQKAERAAKRKATLALQAKEAAREERRRRREASKAVRQVESYVNNPAAHKG